MATASLQKFLRGLTRGMMAESLAGQSDRQLVERFLAERNEAVFEAIVRRHGPMVYRVCFRILKQSQDAEDAFQATFLVLAQKLRGVRKRASLASWLHGVAHRVALKARAQAAVRRRHERQAAHGAAMPPDEASWGELSAVLDAELRGLPEKWRQPLVLCYLEGRTQEEAAGQLGWSKNTLRRRLEEAREALGRRVRRRGVWPAVLSALLLSDCVASATPAPGLLASTVEAAACFAAGQPARAAVSAKVVALSQGVATAMTLTKSKWAVVLVLVLGLAGGAGMAKHSSPAEPAQSPAAEGQTREKQAPDRKADPLDSLAFMSSEIAEARVQRLYKEGGLDLAEVKVLKVHKGTFREGNTAVVAALFVYHKLKKITGNTTPLAVGDHLILFLVRARASALFPVPEGADIYMPVPSGVRLVEDDRVLGFAQRERPGPYVAYTGRDSRPSPTLKRFQADLAVSIRTAAALARDFGHRKGADAAPWLLNVLRSRSKQPGEFPPRDHIAELACARLAELHKPDLLDEALPLAQEGHARGILERGFGSPVGRDFLLARVNDVKAPLPERIRHARVLANAGAVYRSTFCEIGPNSYSWRIVGKPDCGNSGYLTRIARAALAARRHEDLCHALVISVALLGRDWIHSPDAEIRADLKGALAVLKALYDAGPSEQLKYAIETAAAGGDREAFQSLKSPCGRFISIVWPADPKKYTPSDTPRLLYDYAYDATLYDSETVPRPSLVLVHLKSQASYVLPTRLRVKGGGVGGGSGAAVELPCPLPHGPYRVFLRLTEKGKIVSTGHYFETEL